MAGKAMRYRREIDGLRAVAVLPVIFFHAGFNAFSGGFVGVDVFFVISGYLITSIIAIELNDERFSVARFYERRARRILPALAIVIAASFALGWHFLLPSDMKDFSQSIAAAGLFSSNLLFWKESGYFGPAAEFKPLLHTWSLGVEEQFYIAFPLLLMVAWKLGKKWTAGTILIVCASSFLLAELALRWDASANFFLLPGRAWELAIGALVALWLRQRPTASTNPLKRELLALLGIGLIGASVLMFDSSTPFPSVYTLMPTLGTALVIVFADAGTRTGKVLGWKPLVGIGLVSYSAYLWHQPLFAFARHSSLREPSIAVYLLLSIASLGLAALSWKFVETPFRRRDFLRRRSVFAFAGIVTVSMVAVGMTGHLTDGYFFRDDYSRRMAAVEHSLRINFGLNRACEGGFTTDSRCRTSDEPELLLWGDSYAMHWAPALMASRPGLRMVQATMSMCGPVLGAATYSGSYGHEWGERCIESNDDVLAYLRSTPSIRYVVVGSIFSQFVGSRNELLLRDGSVVPAADVGDDLLAATLQSILDLGITPVILAPMPADGRDIGKCLARSVLLGRETSPCQVDRNVSRSRQIEVDRLLDNASPLARMIDPADVLCGPSKCRSILDNKFIYRDSGHLSVEGSAVLGRQIALYASVAQSNNSSINSEQTNMERTEPGDF